MLTFNFKRVFKARGIEKPFSYLVKAGYSDSFATRVVNSKIERMNLKDVEALCGMLNCTPNDILEWIPDKNEKNTENHPPFRPDENRECFPAEPAVERCSAE